MLYLIIASMATGTICAYICEADLLAYTNHLRKMHKHCMQLTINRYKRFLSPEAKEREITMCEQIAAELTLYSNALADSMRLSNERGNESMVRSANTYYQIPPTNKGNNKAQSESVPEDSSTK